MTPKIARTKLWSNSLGSNSPDSELEAKKELLRSVLRKFREHAAVLTSRIAATFPQLTIHDVTHLDALWETADLIAGEQYPLNPLEAFVLGGAILLHDAAHCFEAYEKGITGVRDTLTWKDAFAAEKLAHPDENLEALERYSDFAAIRLLHARQAEKLGQSEWKSEDGKTFFFLIEDVELRSRFGAEIGKIAASHNWSIEDVKSRLRDQINAPGNWPSGWRVDPIKIACLLRCADAAHLDDRRAPDFLLALIRRSGISLDHWKAQNWLARVDIDHSDATRSSLLFTSTHAFEAHDANAWWVAYDAIAVLDGEIKSCNSLLRSRTQKDISPDFKIQRVTGANSPSELNKSIETKGWIPTSAKIHVGNLERLVQNLGGKNLYGVGDNFAIVLRELIQNARDAIAARRALASNFEGRITVKVIKKSETQTILEIRDDGIGMSERTMTGALLDFGTSFWVTDLVRSEFPGLRSSSFRPIGKFGIGFYAVFMVASEVLVSSRRFDEGLSNAVRLHFPDGLTLRPTLAKGSEDGYDVSSSTCVRLTINKPIESVKLRLINEGQPTNEWALPLGNYIATICSGLDVSVSLQIESEQAVVIHENIEHTRTQDSISRWLNRITFRDINTVKISDDQKAYIDNIAKRVRRIEHDGRLFGLAALSNNPEKRALKFLTTDTVGGLTDAIQRGCGSYVGYMDNFPASAKRDSAKKAVPPSVLEAWAKDQISLLQQENATPQQFHSAAISMCELDIDPIEIITFPVYLPDNRYLLLTFEQIFNVLQSTDIGCLKSRQFDFAETHIAPTSYNNLPMLRPLENGNLIKVELEDGKPKFDYSLLGCLDRLTRSKGRTLSYKIERVDLKTVFGTELDLLTIKLI